MRASSRVHNNVWCECEAKQRAGNQTEKGLKQKKQNNVVADSCVCVSVSSAELQCFHSVMRYCSRAYIKRVCIQHSATFHRSNTRHNSTANRHTTPPQDDRQSRPLAAVSARTPTAYNPILRPTAHFPHHCTQCTEEWDRSGPRRVADGRDKGALPAALRGPPPPLPPHCGGRAAVSARRSHRSPMKLTLCRETDGQHRRNGHNSGQNPHTHHSRGWG